MAPLRWFVLGLLMCVSQSKAATYTESDRVSEYTPTVSVQTDRVEIHYHVCK